MNRMSSVILGLPLAETESSGFSDLSKDSNSLFDSGNCLLRSACYGAETSVLLTSSGYGSTVSTSDSSNRESWDSASTSSSSGAAMSRANSTLSWILAKSTSSIFHLKRASWIPRRRAGSKRSCNLKSSSSNGRKPVLLKRAPFGKSSKYLTVYVGTRGIEQSVKFVISRTLLVHPLFQVLLKCSEDEFGEDYAVENGVSIVCDVALFLQVVRAVDDSLWSAKNTEAHHHLDMSLHAGA